MIDETAADVGQGAPTTARLQEVLNSASRVVIAEGAPDDVDSPDISWIEVTGSEIISLAQVLAIVDGGSGDRCRCDGWPTIMIYGAEGKLTDTWTLHHQTSLRSIGDCDADLQDGTALTQWLADHGLTGSRDIQAKLAVQETEADQRRDRWLKAAPAGLTAAADVATSPGHDHQAWSHDQHDAQARLTEQLQDHYPDGIERIRILLAWAGIPARETTGGLKWYDLAVQKLLLAEDPKLILTALTSNPPTPTQLDGAAEVFTSFEWINTHGQQLPKPVSAMLIRHIQATGTEPMKFRMNHGYYAAE